MMSPKLSSHFFILPEKSLQAKLAQLSVQEKTSSTILHTNQTLGTQTRHQNYKMVADGSLQEMYYSSPFALCYYTYLIES